MRIRSTPTQVIAVLLVFGAGCASKPSDDPEEAAARGGAPAGEREARRDIRRGHLELRTFGLPATWTIDYERLLNDRLGVTLNPVAGCAVSEMVVDKTGAYNNLMTAEIERRFGKGILDRLEEEAEATFSTTRPTSRTAAAGDGPIPVPPEIERQEISKPNPYLDRK